MRVLVFGNSGSGKSTLARQLALEHRLAHLDLDSIVWKPGEIAVQRSPEATAASLAAFLAEHSRWVIEGCYGELVQTAASHCTELVFLNPGLETCLERNRERPWEPHKYASKEAQDAMLESLQAFGNRDSAMSALDLIRAYIKAYNAMDVDAMLTFFDDACVFENISGGKVTVRTAGKAGLGALARRLVETFASREQRLLSLTEGPTRAVAEIDYHAVLRIDLSPELKAGSELQLRGVSVIEFADGKIIRLSDYS